MGVKGLFTYLKNLQAFERLNLSQFSKQFRLLHQKNLTLVVDGSAFIYFLKNLANFPLLPNDLSQFYRTTLFVLSLFQSQFIDLIVVFDGLFESAKINEKQKRRIRQWNQVDNILGSIEKNEVLHGQDPSSVGLYRCLLIQLLHRFNVVTFTAQGEADRYIAYICKKQNHFGVLSCDTDFLIFGVNLLRLDSLQYSVDETTPMTVDLYTPQRVANLLRVPVDHLPLLSCLLGNDFISSRQLTSLYQHLHISKQTLSEKITKISQYLSGGINLNNLKRRLNPQLFSVLCEAMNFYSFDTFKSPNSFSPSQNNEKKKKKKKKNDNNNNNNNNNSDEKKNQVILSLFDTNENFDDWKRICPKAELLFQSVPQLKTYFQQGYLAPELLSVFLFRVIWLPIVMTNVNETDVLSPYTLTRPLRQLLYGLILRLTESDSSSSNNNNTSKKSVTISEKIKNKTHHLSPKYRFMNGKVLCNFRDLWRENVSLDERLNVFTKCMTKNWSATHLSTTDPTLTFASFILRYIVERQDEFSKSQSRIATNTNTNDRVVITEQEFDALLAHILLLKQRSENKENELKGTCHQVSFTTCVDKERHLVLATKRGMYLNSLWSLSLFLTYNLNILCGWPFGVSDLRLENLFDTNTFFTLLSLLEHPKEFVTLSTLLNGNQELESLFNKLKQKILEGLSPWKQQRDLTTNPTLQISDKSFESNDKTNANITNNNSFVIRVCFENFPQRIQSLQSALQHLTYFGVDTSALNNPTWVQRENTRHLAVAVSSIEEAKNFLYLNRRIAHVDGQVLPSVIIVKIQFSTKE